MSIFVKKEKFELVEGLVEKNKLSLKEALALLDISICFEDIDFGTVSIPAWAPAMVPWNTPEINLDPLPYKVTLVPEYPGPLVQYGDYHPQPIMS